MRPSTAKSGQSAARGEQVLDAAARVFARQGYEGTSIDDIADELGSTKGRVYHYYRSKSDMLLGVLNAGSHKLIDVVRPLSEDASLSPAERLRNMARAHAMTMMTHHSYQYVTLRSLDQHLHEGPRSSQSDWEAIRVLRDEYEGLFQGVLEAGCKDGSLSTDDVRLAVRGVLGALNWITVWYRPEASGAGDRRSAETIAESLSRFVVEGVQGES
ncbi:TetR/AcrR family transcriptional regulator [Streptomyces sp. GbtcB7]|uniref:TetR/AcrR family transcriptional regulator n=1 Tax=Streptomyces sp. GbtcB7 TaxID=2824752 RepID=UPI001C30C542|nr:TetR/AcrR family transcriptional regulator [Streptomyces sp. GbtcB7]